MRWLRRDRRCVEGRSQSPSLPFNKLIPSCGAMAPSTHGPHRGQCTSVNPSDASIVAGTVPQIGQAITITVSLPGILGPSLRSAFSSGWHSGSERAGQRGRMWEATNLKTTRMGLTCWWALAIAPSNFLTIPSATSALPARGGPGDGQPSMAVVLAGGVRRWARRPCSSIASSG
jgi:hypothetical protein